jgi:ABC-type phosphate transport system substrate-binding protein
MKKKLLLAMSMATLLLSSMSNLANAQIAVVVGAKSAVTGMSKEQTAALFLGKSSQLPGAGTPVLVDQSETSELRKNFYSKVADKTPAQVKAIWARLVFSGKSSPPKEVVTSIEVKKIVASNPDAVGYIEKSAVDSSVKVLLEID